MPATAYVPVAKKKSVLDFDSPAAPSAQTLSEPPTTYGGGYSTFDEDSNLLPPDLSGLQRLQKLKPELDRQAADRARPRGRLATIFTGASGLLDDPKTSRRTLLGY